MDYVEDGRLDESSCLLVEEEVEEDERVEAPRLQ